MQSKLKKEKRKEKKKPNRTVGPVGVRGWDESGWKLRERDTKQRHRKMREISIRENK